LPLIKVTSATQQSLGSKENMCKYCSSNYLQHVAVLDVRKSVHRQTIQTI